MYTSYNIYDTQSVHKDQFDDKEHVSDGFAALATACVVSILGSRSGETPSEGMITRWPKSSKITRQTQ